MENIEIEFSREICKFCVYYNSEKCGKILVDKINDLNICKCLNYERKEHIMKEFDKYIAYTYYDEVGNYVAILKERVSREIFNQLKFRYDEVRISE